jgi:hypothetical protein
MFEGGIISGISQNGRENAKNINFVDLNVFGFLASIY